MVQPRRLLATLAAAAAWMQHHASSAAASPWGGGPPAVDPHDPHFLVSPSLNGTQLAGFYPVGYYPCIDGVVHQDSPGQLEAFYQLLIDQQVASGVNYMRQVLSMGQPADASSLPYEFAAPDSQRVDLSRFNQTHFAFWDRVLSYAARHGVVVQLILLDAWHNKKWLVETDATMSWSVPLHFRLSHSFLHKNLKSPCGAGASSTTSTSGPTTSMESTRRLRSSGSTLPTRSLPRRKPWSRRLCKSSAITPTLFGRLRTNLRGTKGATWNG